MVGMIAPSPRERVASLTNSSMGISCKLEHLRRLKEDLLQQDDPVLLSEFLPPLVGLQSDRFSPVRNFIIQMIGEIGLKHLNLLSEITPALTTALNDGTPAVARQAIVCGIDLFRFTLKKVAIQGLHSNEMDNSLESSWTSMIKLKNQIYSFAFQPGNDGIRLRALKFVEVIILLFTPDPNDSQGLDFEGKNVGEFNISMIRGAHPILNVGDLSMEASKSLGLLLDQLRFPTVKSLSNSVVIVLISILAGIAKKRPAFYGRILPVLLSLSSSISVSKGANYALKNAFLSCLKCAHPGAVPWRERLVGALRDMEVGVVAEKPLDLGRHDSPIKEDKPSIRDGDVNVGKKRSAAEDTSVDASTKRLRPTPTVSKNELKDNNPSVGLTTSRGADVNIGPVQQLVAMFGALIAQGEKAVGSLEILISSISTDLLAEVVMVNMHHLPPNRPEAEGDEQLLLNSTSASNTQVKHPSFSLSNAFPQIASLLDAQSSDLIDTIKTERKVEHHASIVSDGDVDMVSVGTEEGLLPSPLSSDGIQPEEGLLPSPLSSDGIQPEEGLLPPLSSDGIQPEEGLLPPGAPLSSDGIQSGMEKGCSAILSHIHDEGNLESGIPGLESAAHSHGLVVSSLSHADGSQELVTSSGGRSPQNVLPSMSTDKSEELSSKSTATDGNSLISSTATSVVLSNQLVLPKISAPVIDLSEKQKDNLQKMAFARVVEAYKKIAVAGGSQFSLLVHLAVEFPSELEPWKLLEKHILSDYLKHNGHESTLRVLYRLFSEAEEQHDLFSSTTATSVYETFLLAVAETLRDSFPASDKSLSRLLGDVPYLPKSVFKLLECLCSPDEEELQSVDRVTQGLIVVWNLILLRPPIREPCLKIALQSTVHHLEKVRMKAIRLVVNKLYPLPSITQQIEDYAKEMLLSVLNSTQDRDESNAELHEDSIVERPSTPGAEQCMSLYFALCTKKHSLLQQVFDIYKSTSEAVRQAIHGHIPILIRAIGSSPELLRIISDPPTGSEDLLMQVLHTLTDGIVPSPELIVTVQKLYDSKVKNVEILVPILQFLPKDEVLVVLPHFLNLPSDKFQAILIRALQGSSVFSPAEVLIAIHGIDPEKDGVPLKKITDACNACFEQKQIFTQEVIAQVLNQMVEQIPLPLLFMRTVIQTLGTFPGLAEFIMEILSRLVSKQIWKYPKLWVGFLKCALLTKPQSFGVLLQLPPTQLGNALNRVAELKVHLVAHANEPSIRASLPKSVLVVLGLASDSETCS